MAEHQEAPEAETPEAAAPTSPAAVAVALGRTSKRSKSLDDKAAAFLVEQTELIRLQAEDLHEHREVQLERLRLGRWKDRISLALQGMTALVGLAVAVAIGAMAWEAHEDHGLTIGAFSVPPDLGQRGLTGQVVAARVLDRLSEFQAQTVSDRPAASYADNWGDDIKVEIPETGVSIGELNRYLRDWLGHGTRVTGEVVRTPTGVSVTARAGSEPGRTFQGADGDMDALIAQAAEAVYASTQPYRYAVYLSSHGKPDEALAAYQRLARSGAAEDRGWAYAGWATLLMAQGKVRGALGPARAAFRIDPGIPSGGATLVVADRQLGRLEEAYQVMAHEPSGRGQGRPISKAAFASILGDTLTSTRMMESLNNYNFEGQTDFFQTRFIEAIELMALREVTRAYRVAQGITSSKVFNDNLQARLDGTAAVALEDWPRVVAVLEPQIALTEGDPVSSEQILANQGPQLALAYARLGRTADAQALIARTPLDCEPCLEARGQVAAAARDWAGVDRWFAEAARQSPSLPFANTAWAQALLDKGDVDGAVAKLKLAHRLGPRFADPLELRGEALMRRGDFQGAMGKFREADKRAPRWGRNHLRWGQALAKLGRTDEARAQWRAAATMDLSAADRSELGRSLAGLGG